MPTKFKALLGIIGVSIILRLVFAVSPPAGIEAGTGAWIGLAIWVALFVGLIRGSEGVRMTLIILAALNLAFSAINMTTLADIGFGFIPLYTFLVLYGAFAAVYTIWCLTREDVKNYMLSKTTGMTMDEL